MTKFLILQPGTLRNIPKPSGRQSTRRDARLLGSVANIKFYEPLEDRRLMSASLTGVHLAPAVPAGTVFTFAPQPTTPEGAVGAASSHTKGVPALSSRPGAPYTIYLDVAGFNYVGAWFPDGDHEHEPGFTPALNDKSPTGTFTAAEQAQIKVIWQQVAQSYIGLNVNVTTVDPAPANIQSDDTLRRQFYDNTPNMMHTVIGSGARAAFVTADNPDGNWLPGADGVSPGIGVVTGSQNPTTHAGDHTNFMMSQAKQGAANGGVIDGLYIGGISAHENAHSFGLFHQGDYTGNGATRVAEYSTGDDGSGFGTYVPTIGDANGKQRIAFRDGTADVSGDNERQNDFKVMLATDTAAKASTEGRSGGVDLHFVDDGIGNTIATATALPLNGSSVNFSLAKGVIVPKSESNPIAIGAGNYTTDYFSFNSDGATPITLTVTDSTSFLVAGVADGNGTFNSSLNIYRANGTIAGFSTEDVTTLKDTFSGVLPAGTYYAGIGSRGGHQQVNAASYDPAYYFDTGAFFLTGSGFKTSGVNTAPVVTTNPVNKTAAVGASVTFTAAATGTPTPTVQWQVSTNGGSSYANVPGATSPSLTFTATAAQTGYKYRAVFTNSVSTATTTAATLTVTNSVGSTITGVVFNDHNGSGSKDPGEEVMSGIRVYADLDGSGVYKSPDPFVYTNGNGVYTFTNLPAGTYAFKTQPPTGFQQNFPFGVTARTITVTAAGGVFSGQNFGITTSSHVSGFVKEYRDGVYINLVNVAVTIKATDGTGPVYTRFTDSNGYYGIGGLPNKAFTITLQLPAGYKLASGSVVRMTPKLASGKNADLISFKLLKSFT